MSCPARAGLTLVLGLSSLAIPGCGDDSSDAAGSGGTDSTTATDATSGSTGTGPGSGSTGDGAGGAGDGGTASGSTGQGGGGDGGGGDGGTAQVGACSQGEDGAWGTPTHTLTLPPANPDGTIYYPDLQASFPEVDWNTLERLYIPAGEYKSILLKNLPDRSLDAPLIITNQGGQVKVGGMEANYNIAIGGGSGWIFTGRYDPVSETGDAAFVGHRACDYGSARGNYGIWVDGAFDNAPHGVAVGDRATDYQIEFFEVERVSFAGIMLKSDDTGDATMRNVSVHDTYVHDVFSEGMYIGSTQAEPQHSFENLRLYNNRIMRTGSESFQIGQLGDGCEIFNNVFAMGGMAWKNPWSSYQDGGAQIGVRYGSIDIHHNIIMGAAEVLLPFFLQPRTGDTHNPGDQVQFRDNYMSESRSIGAYLFPDYDGTTTYSFARNTWRKMEYSYNEIAPDGSPPGAVLITFNDSAPMSFTDNTWEGDIDFLNQLPTGEGTSNGGNLTGSGNVHGAVPAVQFVDFMGWPDDTDAFRLEAWAATSPPMGDAPIEYQPGDYVTYDGELYVSIAAGPQAQNVPPDHPEVWQHLPKPVDDVRLTAGSPHQGIGLLDTTE